MKTKAEETENQMLNERLYIVATKYPVKKKEKISIIDFFSEQVRDIYSDIDNALYSLEKRETYTLTEVSEKFSIVMKVINIFNEVEGRNFTTEESLDSMQQQISEWKEQLSKILEEVDEYNER